MSDDGLDDQTGQRGDDPEIAQLVYICTEVGQDAACISVLQAKSHLDAHEPHAEVDDAAHGEARFFQIFFHRPKDQMPSVSITLMTHKTIKPEPMVGRTLKTDALK